MVAGAAGLTQSRARPAAFRRTLITTPPRPAPSTPVQHLTVKENETLLNEQRLARPSSPHFTIYQPQITWLLSIANRVTGVGLSAGAHASFPLGLAFPRRLLAEWLD